MVFSQNNITSIIIEDKEYNIQSISFMGTEAEWNTNSDYIPKAGELIIYTPDEKNSSYRLKIGDGTKRIVELTLNYIETVAERDNLLDIIKNNTNRIESAAKDITDLKEDFLDSENNFNNALSKKVDIIQHANGKLITLDNAGYTPVKGLKLFGKSTQFTTTGKNLVDCVITATSQTSQYRPIKLQPGHYKLTLFNPDGTTTGVQAGAAYIAHFLDAEKNRIVSYVQNGVPVSAENAAKITQIIITYDGRQYTGSHTTVCAQLEASSVPTPYEPYTGGIPAPNPDYPQELESVGESKNLLSKPFVIGSYLTTGLNTGYTTVLCTGAIYLKAGTYTLSDAATNNGKDRDLYIKKMLDETHCQDGQQWVYDTAMTFTISEDGLYSIQYNRRTSKAYTADEIALINNSTQLEFGSVVTPYKPYGKGNIKTTVAGKNLADDSVLASLGFVWNDTNKEWYLSSQADRTVNLWENTNNVKGQFTLSYWAKPECTDGGNGTTGLISIKYTDGTSYRITSNQTTVGVYQKYMLTSDPNKTVERVSYGYYWSGKTWFKEIQFEASTSATEYEPYNPQVLTASTPNGLPGVPVSSGGNYTDENGQQWVSDEIDFARGVYVQRVGKVDMGSLAWDFDKEYSVHLGYVADIKPGTLNMLCSHYKTSNRADASSDDFTVYGRPNGIGVKNSNYTDAETFKGAMAGAMVEYELAGPIETALSPEELAQYATLHTNKPNTTVYNDAGAEMKVKYHTPNSAVPMTYGAANSGSVLGIDEHGCVAPVSREVINTHRHDVSFIDNAVSTDALAKALTEKADIIQHADGELITLDDAAYTPIKGLKLYGKTTQFTTTGKNLFDPAIFTENGLPETNGVYGGIPQYLNEKLLSYSAFKEKTVYTLSWYGYSPALDGTKRTLFAIFNYTDGTKASGACAVLHSTSTKYTFSSDSTKTIASISFSFGTNLDVYISQPMLVEGAEIPYEPYTGGIPAPNPDYPQELVSAGESGAINTTVAGKNLLIPEVATHTGSGLTTTVDKDGVITINGTSTSNTWIPVGQFSPDGQFAVTASWSDTNIGSMFTINVDGKYTYVYNKEVIFEKYNDNKTAIVGLIVVSGTYSNLTIKPMIRPTSVTDATYEPYKEHQTLTASTPNGLPGIPVSSDKYLDIYGGNYTDSNGQEWIGNYVDFNKGVYVQNCKQYNLLNFISKCKQVDNTEHSSNILRFDFTNPFNIEPASTILCNRFENNYIHANNLSVVRNKEGISSHSQFSIVSILIDKSRLATADLAGFTAYLESNETIILCQTDLVERPLTEEELTAYAALHTNNPYTTAYNDASAYMEMDYYTPTTAVQMVHSPADEGKVLSIDQHGCVVLTDLATRIARIESQLAYMAIITNNEEMLEV